MNKINKEWHLANKMPKNPSEEQRLLWHIEHNKNCECRKPSPELQAKIDEYRVKQLDK
jgi:hypothetical protein